LFICEEFVETLDHIQSHLLNESKIWSMPKTSLLKVSVDIQNMIEIKNVRIVE